MYKWTKDQLRVIQEVFKNDLSDFDFDFNALSKPTADDIIQSARKDYQTLSGMKYRDVFCRDYIRRAEIVINLPRWVLNVPFCKRCHNWEQVYWMWINYNEETTYVRKIRCLGISKGQKESLFIPEEELKRIEVFK